MHVELNSRVESLATDASHGASWLAKEALETLVESVELGGDPLETARTLVRARPAIGSIAGALGRVLAAGRTPEQLVEEAHAVIAGRVRAAA